MNAGTNAVTPFIGADVNQLNDALGITQFQGQNNWFQTMGGLLVQGGLVQVNASATLVVPFNTGFVTQVLGVFVQGLGPTVAPWSVDAVSNSQFSLVNGLGSTRLFNWFAVGV